MMVHPATASSLLLGAAAVLLPAAPVRSQPQITLGPSIGGDGTCITDIQHAPGDSDRLFVVLRNGQIRILRGFGGSNAQYDATDFLDIGSSGTGETYRGCNECGLLGLAFHPNYANNGYLYVNYMKGSPRRTIISRYQVNGTDANRANLTSEREWLNIAQTYGNHNGGQIQFGPCPSGYCLYIGMGDGGSSGDPNDAGQRADTLLGKMLRYDVGSDGLSWTPMGAGLAGFNETVWALGLRNPWRFSFDSSTNDLYIADVGQDAREEVSVRPASSTGGENYGWRECEGFIGFNPSSSQCNATGTPVFNYTAPIFDYSHSIGRSITGGYVYRGSAYPDLAGVYIYGDYVDDWITGAFNGAGSWDQTYTNVISLTSPTTFGQDANGELYVGTYNGVVRRIVGPSPPTSSPTANPTSSPSKNPTSSPTAPAPTSSPVGPVPTSSPTTGSPTSSPTANPTSNPTANPSSSPSKTPSSSPTKSPINLSVSCPATPDHTRLLLDGLVLHFSVVEDPANPTIGGIFCGELVLNRLAWIAIGRQTQLGGGMEGDVVIGHYVGGTGVVKKYVVSGQGQAPLEMPAGSQTLFDETIVQDAVAETTTLRFTKFLKEAGELSYLSNDSNAILYAVGDPDAADPSHISNSHARNNQGRGSGILDLSPCPTNPCSGGQVCQLPLCSTCDVCSEADCESTSGCTWNAGGLYCPGTRCPGCGDKSSCTSAGCSWNEGQSKCNGGPQPNSMGGGCTGTVDPSAYKCPANPIGSCGDGTCDTGEDECSCPADCSGQCVTGSPTASPTKIPTQGCVGGGGCTNTKDCCGTFKCGGKPKTCRPP